MTNLILVILIVFSSFNVINAEPIQQDKVSHLFAGAFAEEHLKAKGVPFLERFIIIGGLGLAKELIDKEFNTQDLAFTVSGQLFSMIFTEVSEQLTKFVDSFEVKLGN